MWGGKFCCKYCLLLISRSKIKPHAIKKYSASYACEQGKRVLNKLIENDNNICQLIAAVRILLEND